MRRILRLVWLSVIVLALAPAFLPAQDAVKLPANFFDLTGQAGLPVYLKCGQGVRGGVDGLGGGEIKTIDTNYFKSDFTLDVIFQQTQTEKGRFDAAVGIGENEHDGGWLKNSLECQISGDRNSGRAEIVFDHTSKKPKLGDIKSSGPHLLRIRKIGDNLTFMLLPDYTGEDPDTFHFTQSYAVADFKSKTAFLNRLNSNIYLSGNVLWRAIRLQVDGKDVDPGKRADANLEPVADTVPFYTLGTASRIPSFLAEPDDQSTEGRFTDQGWKPGRIYRSRSADYLKKNFTLDLVVHFSPGERDPLMIGMGENGRDSGNWILNSVCASIHGPGNDGKLYSTFHDFWNQPMFGKLGPDHPGPNLIRMQRVGDTLMFAACADYKDKYNPDFITVMPSLQYQAPYLTSQNGYLFFGDHGVIEKLRFIVDGKSINPNEEQSGSIPGVASDNSPGAPRVAAKLPSAGNQPTEVKPGTPDIAPPQDNRPRLALLSAKHQMTPGLGGTLLLLEENQLRRLGPDGFTVVETQKLPGSYLWIGERKAYFVAMSDETKSLDLIDKKTLKIIRTIQMDYHRRWDLCLNPARPISYVTVEKATDDGFLDAVLIVDETSGDVREPDDFIGKFLKISPDGRTLYSAYNTIYKKGDQLLFNPDRIDVVPEYGDIDILLAYDVQGALPRVLSAKDGAGGNCQGLALSSDGHRVSFLSYVGYPLYSDNIAAWDSTDFTKRPVAYATKSNKADCKHLAFHPELPIAAAASHAGAICFDRESGAVQKDRLELAGSFDGTKVNDLIFSPDGTNLILDCEQNGSHFLVRVKVNLSSEEAAKAKQGPPTPQKPAAPSSNNPRV